MKKVKYFIIILLIVISIQILCNAQTKTIVYLETNKKNIYINEEVEISINIKDEKTAAYNIILYFDDTKFEFLSGPENINIDGNRIIIVWYDDKGGSSPKEGVIEQIRFKAKAQGISIFKLDGEIYNENGELIQTNFENLQIYVEDQEFENKNERNIDKSTAKLKSLRLDQAGIIPEFESDVFEYDIQVLNNIKSIDVEAIPENVNSQIEITGNTNLQDGLNIIKISVTSEDKMQSNIYIIKVTKTEDLEQANTNLETLAIQNTLLYPSFDNNITKYTAEVSNDITKLNILVIPENENGKAEILGNENLKEGNNKIIIRVTAQNGFTIREYEINVKKRNVQEDEEYKKEQEEQTEELQKAYEMEKISLESNNQVDNNDNNNEVNQKNNHKVLIFIGIVLAILFIVILYKLIIIRKNK